MSQSKVAETPITPKAVLRLILIAAYVPAFPIFIANGIVSHSFAPMIGLLPMTTSSLSAMIYYRLRNFKVIEPAENRERDEKRLDGMEERTRGSVHVFYLSHALVLFAFLILAWSSIPWAIIFAFVFFRLRKFQLFAQRTKSRRCRSLSISLAKVLTPDASLAVDASHGAVLLAVLLFTFFCFPWGWHIDSTILAAYATVPLMVNCFIHLWLTGVGLHERLETFIRPHQDNIPSDCPYCHQQMKSPHTKKGVRYILVDNSGEGVSYRDISEDTAEESCNHQQEKGKKTQ